MPRCISMQRKSSSLVGRDARHQRRQLPLHCLNRAGFCGRPSHRRPHSLHLPCLAYAPQLRVSHICISDKRWCASALKGRLFVSEAVSLGARAFAPSAVCAFHSSPLSCLENRRKDLQPSAGATPTLVLSSTRDCDGHVYNVI